VGTTQLAADCLGERAPRLKVLPVREPASPRLGAVQSVKSAVQSVLVVWWRVVLDELHYESSLGLLVDHPVGQLDTCQIQPENPVEVELVVVALLLGCTVPKLVTRGVSWCFVVSL
jgi:hypothetical protein